MPDTVKLDPKAVAANVHSVNSGGKNRLDELTAPPAERLVEIAEIRLNQYGRKWCTWIEIASQLQNDLAQEISRPESQPREGTPSRQQLMTGCMNFVSGVTQIAKYRFHFQAVLNEGGEKNIVDRVAVRVGVSRTASYKWLAWVGLEVSDFYAKERSIDEHLAFLVAKSQRVGPLLSQIMTVAIERKMFTPEQPQPARAEAEIAEVPAKVPTVANQPVAERINRPNEKQDSPPPPAGGAPRRPRTARKSRTKVDSEADEVKGPPGVKPKG